MSKYQDPNFDKKLYTERRKRGVPGTIGYVRLHQVVKDDKGKGQRVPIAGMVGNQHGTPSLRSRSRSKVVDRSFTKKRLNSPFFGHNPAEVVPPVDTPDLSNHDRMLMRRKAREAERAALLKTREANIVRQARVR